MRLKHELHRRTVHGYNFAMLQKVEFLITTLAKTVKITYVGRTPNIGCFTLHCKLPSIS